jgi:hypothetical protein
MRIYERQLRVPEYFVFDPTGRYIPEQLRGYRLVDGAYQPIQASGGRLRSRALDLDILVSGPYFRFADPATGELVPTPEEIDASRLHAEAQAATEARARLAAEAEIARLRAELDALRGGSR